MVFHMSCVFSKLHTKECTVCCYCCCYLLVQQLHIGRAVSGLPACVRIAGRPAVLRASSSSHHYYYQYYSSSTTSHYYYFFVATSPSFKVSTITTLFTVKVIDFFCICLFLICFLSFARSKDCCFVVCEFAVVI